MVLRKGRITIKKHAHFIFLAGAFTVLLSTAAFAGTWKEDQTGWYWQEMDGTYPVSAWEWLDGNQDGFAFLKYYDEYDSYQSDWESKACIHRISR